MPTSLTLVLLSLMSAFLNVSLRRLRSRLQVVLPEFRPFVSPFPVQTWGYGVWDSRFPLNNEATYQQEAGMRLRRAYASGLQEWWLKLQHVLLPLEQ